MPLVPSMNVPKYLELYWWAQTGSGVIVLTSALEKAYYSMLPSLEGTKTNLRI